MGFWLFLVREMLVLPSWDIHFKQKSVVVEATFKSNSWFYLMAKKPTWESHLFMETQPTKTFGKFRPNKKYWKVNARCEK